MTARTVVVLPTYNEIDSLPVVVARLRESAPDVDILIVDDSSPDGTGDLAELLSSRMPEVHVLHRAQKEGLGRAYIAGFGEALSRGYDVIVQADADGSHRPEDLPALLDAVDDADVVVGSRWVGGGAVGAWSTGRYLLSRAGSLYAGAMLGLRQKDITGGYRVFRAEALRSIRVDDVRSHGYCFQIETLDRAARAGFRIIEVPITFDDRLHGDSKMSVRIVVEALRQVTMWGVRRRLHGAEDTPAPAREGMRV
ncbi:polyprenol monophosphomannose synthase [Streptomyces sp. AC495_CC817]|uniref:polyprenol monophosphomannose synthase n=1 Tax=Streptomyces sp. AC495_CC817 TaxID=2823900 RepID=UPI001C26AABC|nr:polyprenol monophosphomannose synthase [Streptomyces sp. AC495_CC817]